MSGACGDGLAGGYAALVDLIDYVNDFLGASLARGKGDPGLSARCGQLRLDHDRVEAVVGPFLLGSVPRALRSAGPVPAPKHWLRQTVVATPLGRSLPPQSLIRLQATEEAAVAMDRLYRLLHMLNHLACALPEESLWVDISLRHLLALEHGHGTFFEEIIRACGLGPERLVLVVTPEPASTADERRISEACQNYRARGFALALNLALCGEPAGEHWRSSLVPDWVGLPAERVARLRAALGEQRVVAWGRHDVALRAGDRYEAVCSAVPRFAA